jgi:hypothetical protein
MSSKVVGVECKFAIHIPSYNNGSPDIHMVKEAIHYEDGTIKPNIKFVKDFKRPIYCTVQSKRNHKQKKEWEDLDNLIEKSVTQSELRNEVAKLVEKPWSKDPIRKLCASPYIYGADITSTALIKDAYQRKYPGLTSRFTVASYDIETDVINGTKDVIMATIAFQDKVFTSVSRDFIRGISNPVSQVHSKTMEYIGEYIEKLNMADELHIADDPVDIIRATFAKAHEWKPDILAIWNIDYDVPVMLENLQRYGVDPKDIFCDPSVPDALRICKYKRGADKKRTAAGRVIPINIEARWHTFQCTSSFYFIDAMCAFKYIRLAQQAESSYSLDSILDKILGIRKLKFKEADGYIQLAWHQFMQTHYKLEYIVYNRFDCISMLELDEKTKDLAYTMPSQAGISDFSVFNSQPKMIADKFYMFLLKKGQILGTVGPNERVEEEEVVSNMDDTEPGEDDEDEVGNDVLSMKGWVSGIRNYLR